jgi:hypothetical protein
MKRITAIVLVTLAGFFTAGSLQAQSYEVRAKIPFDFSVGSKQLPSGSYELFSEGRDQNLLEIRNRDQKVSILTLTEETGNSPAYVSELIFNKYGDRYFLSEIRCTSIGMDLEVPPSKQEKQVRTQQAWLGPQQVLVALK